MKVTITAMGIIAMILLPACSSQPTQSESNEADKSSTANTHLVSTSGITDKDNQSATPEAQIIRELYQSGCTITGLELNRRKQQMKVTCANDGDPGSSI